MIRGARGACEPHRVRCRCRTGGAIGLTAEPTAFGLHGQGGIGKSVLIAALGRNEHIRNRFPDGIHWVTVGEQPMCSLSSSNYSRDWAKRRVAADRCRRDC